MSKEKGKIINLNDYIKNKKEESKEWTAEELKIKMKELEEITNLNNFNIQWNQAKIDKLMK